MIGSDYFQTLGIPLLEGRYFPPELKADSPPVVIINETMARHFWPQRERASASASATARRTTPSSGGR